MSSIDPKQKKKVSGAASQCVCVCVFVIESSLDIWSKQLVYYGYSCLATWVTSL